MVGSRCMTIRKQVFNSSYFQKLNVISLNEEHKKLFGTSINSLGYPDMGNGRYSSELSYSDWILFNNSQRGHYNMIESSGSVYATMILAGLFQPNWSSLLGFSYGIGMLIFSFGYETKKGADGRLLGAIIRSLSLIGLISLCFYYGICLFYEQALNFLFQALEVMEDED